MLYARRLMAWGISFAMVFVIGCSQSSQQGAALRGDERITDGESNKLFVQLTAARKEARTANERVNVASQQLRRHIQRLATTYDSKKATARKTHKSLATRTATLAPAKRVVKSDVTASRLPSQRQTSAKPKNTKPPIK